MFNLNFLPNYRTVMIMDNIIIEYLCPNRNLFLMLRESSYQSRQTFLEHWTCAIVSFHCCDLMPGMTYRFYGVPPTVTWLLMIFIINMSKVIQTTLVVLFVPACSLHCRHILGRQKLLVYVCIVHVVAAIFDFTSEEEDWGE